MPARTTTTLTLDADEVDLLDDALSYYGASQMGGGDRDNPDDRRTAQRLAIRLDNARGRLGLTT